MKGVATNPFGISGLTINGYSENASIQVAEAKDERGDNVARDTYEALTAPSADFSIAADFALGGISLGALIDGDTDPDLVINGFSVDTSAGDAPSVSISSESVPTGSEEGHTYTTPAFTLEVDHKAQILFGAFTLSGDGCHVESCNASGSCTITRAYDENGETCAWDVSGGQIEVSVEIVQTGSTAPTFTPAADWAAVSPLTEVEAGADYKKHSATLRYTPVAVAPAV